MPVFLIGQVVIKDEILWQEYVKGVALSLQPFKAKLKYRGEKALVFAGKNPTEHIVIIEFKTVSDASNWYESEPYQSLISLRDKAADVNITIYETTQ